MPSFFAESSIPSIQSLISGANSFLARQSSGGCTRVVTNIMVLTTARNTIMLYNTIAHDGIRSSVKTLEAVRERTRKVVDRLLQGYGRASARSLQHTTQSYQPASCTRGTPRGVNVLLTKGRRIHPHAEGASLSCADEPRQVEGVTPSADVPTRCSRSRCSSRRRNDGTSARAAAPSPYLFCCSTDIQAHHSGSRPRGHTLPVLRTRDHLQE